MFMPVWRDREPTLVEGSRARYITAADLAGSMRSLSVLNARTLSRLVVLPHSVFALPFALVAAIIAHARGPLVDNGHSIGVTIVLIILAVVCARTAAMAFNRVVDADIDLQNPRTALREIPAGKVSRSEGAAVVALASVGFIVCSWALGPHCLLLAPFVLLWLLGYSLSKRFTPYAHFVLGLSLALAPGGAWWVLRPSIEAVPLLLMTGVLLWVAGFDIIYSCQDVAADRRQGIFSVPALLGIDRALRVARWVHVAAFFAFLAVAGAPELGARYVIGLSVLAVLLYRQHRLVTAFDLSRVDQAFFTTNGIISVYFLLLVLLTVR